MPCLQSRSYSQLPIACSAILPWILSSSCHEASPLPRHLLQRVVERMHDLVADLDLQALAAESGYSRSHFLRMFEAATGLTPHRYLLQLRLERAQELIRKGSTSLIDIAALCGFSSHAHMSRIFRQLLGVTPSRYRRNL
jgi:AraC family transcriptional regulator